MLFQRTEEIPGAMDERENVHFMLKHTIDHSVTLSEYEQFSYGLVVDFRNNSTPVRKRAQRPSRITSLPD
jgi:hypothetical protein